jgi:hypothetical protein
MMSMPGIRVRVRVHVHFRPCLFRSFLALFSQLKVYANQPKVMSRTVWFLRIENNFKNPPKLKGTMSPDFRLFKRIYI